MLYLDQVLTRLEKKLDVYLSEQHKSLVQQYLQLLPKKYFNPFRGKKVYGNLYQKSLPDKLCKLLNLPIDETLPWDLQTAIICEYLNLSSALENEEYGPSSRQSSESLLEKATMDVLDAVERKKSDEKGMDEFDGGSGDEDKENDIPSVKVKLDLFARGFKESRHSLVEDFDGLFAKEQQADIQDLMELYISTLYKTPEEIVENIILGETIIKPFAKKGNLDVTILLDDSGSMRDEDKQGWVRAILAFIAKNSSSSSVKLIKYTHHITDERVMTPHELHLYAKRYNAGWGGITTISSVLLDIREPLGKDLMIITDGNDSPGNVTVKNTVIHVVCVHKHNEELVELAKRTGGKAFYVENSNLVKC